MNYMLFCLVDSLTSSYTSSFSAFPSIFYARSFYHGIISGNATLALFWGEFTYILGLNLIGKFCAEFDGDEFKALVTASCRL